MFVRVCAPRDAPLVCSIVDEGELTPTPSAKPSMTKRAQLLCGRVSYERTWGEEDLNNAV